MSDDARLSSELTIQAALRRCASDGCVATIVHRGDAWGGAILLKLNLLDRTFRLHTQTRDGQGRAAWLAVKDGAQFDETEADAYIDRQLARDPDLWVIEIEDRQGRHPFEGKIL